MAFVSGPQPNGGSRYGSGTVSNDEARSCKRPLPAASARAAAPAPLPPSRRAVPPRRSRYDRVATFDSPWALAFLPGSTHRHRHREAGPHLAGRCLERPQAAGRRRSARGRWRPGRAARRGPVADASPRDQMVYLTYSEPSPNGGSGLALARAKLVRDGVGRAAGRPAGDLARSGGRERRPVRRDRRLRARRPLAVPDLGRAAALHAGAGPEPAARQDPPPDARRQARAGQSVGGRSRRADGDRHRSAPRTPKRRNTPRGGGSAGPGRTSRPRKPGRSGHRNPYGLAFAPDGRLWETEMGPRGGDELNLIERGKNYGWPLVSEGVNYDGVPIPRTQATPSSRRPSCSGCRRSRRRAC